MFRSTATSLIQLRALLLMVAARGAVAVEYIPGEPGSTSCPAGSSPIANADVCKAAQDHFKYHLWSFLSKIDDADKPKGCFRQAKGGRTTMGLFFNSHATGGAEGFNSVICAGAFPHIARSSRPWGQSIELAATQPGL